MMLIEEPEASIHPALLRKLVDILRSYSTDTQVLFTTHSAEVMDILRPEEILYVTAPRGRTEVRTLTEPEVEAAKTFMKNEGALSEFFETIDPYQP